MVRIFETFKKYLRYSFLNGVCTVYPVFYYRTYKYEYRGDLWKCPFECYHDDDCDFYVDVHSYCCYGKWSQDVNSYVVSWSNDVTLYVKNGKDDLNFPFQIFKKTFYYFRQRCQLFPFSIL